MKDEYLLYLIQTMRNSKIIVIFILILVSACNNSRRKIQIPVQENNFIWIYKPQGDIFPGPSTPQLEAGKYYNDWVPNDHTFVKDVEGIWHIFGITHPVTTTENVHEGEFLSFHAKASEKGLLSDQGFIDLPKVLPPDDRPGEKLENQAPFVIQKDGFYYMLYGPSPIRLAVSKDMINWDLKGILFSEEKGARDPSLTYYNNIYHLIYCSERKVAMRTSKNLFQWSEPTIIYESSDFDPESPSIVIKDKSFYLFVCSWDGIWDKSDIQGAYQHKTYVYNSEKIDAFLNREPVTILNAHAPEIFQQENQWFISSVEWPNRGVSIDRLSWE